ncbi:MAG: STAS domain-containing protein [Baekduia sp.]
MSELPEIGCRDEGGAFRITLSGEVDLRNAKLIEAAATDALAEQRPIVIDLAAVSYIDSTGVHVIRGLARRAEPLRVTLVAPAGSIARDVLDMIDAGSFAELAEA